MRNCFIHEQEVLGLVTQDTTILCSHASQVQSYNQQVFEKLYPNPGDHVLTPFQHDCHSHPDMQQWLTKKKDFHTLDRVAIGAKVMLTNNISPSKGATNGAIGTVHNIDFTCNPDGDQAVRCIHVKLHGSGHIVKVSRTKLRSTYMHARCFVMRTFPLMLAYAMTGHKSQGATLTGSTIVHIQSAFTPGLAYVMLSRVVSRANLKVVGRLLAEDIVPMTLGTVA